MPQKSAVSLCFRASPACTQVYSGCFSWPPRGEIFTYPKSSRFQLIIVDLFLVFHGRKYVCKTRWHINCQCNTCCDDNYIGKLARKKWNIKYFIFFTLIVWAFTEKSRKMYCRRWFVMMWVCHCLQESSSSIFGDVVIVAAAAVVSIGMAKSNMLVHPSAGWIPAIIHAILYTHTKCAPLYR